jgi:Glycosyltransferase
MSGRSDARPLVAHLIDELPAHGAERLIVDLVACPDPRFRYAVVCLIRGGPLEEDLRELGVPVFVFGRRGRLDPGLVGRLVRWMRKNDVAVVHTHLFTADAYGRLAAWLAGVPAIFCTVHNVVNSWKTPVHRFLDRVLARVSYRVIACTEEVGKVLVERDGIPRERVAVVANGIDLRRFRAVSGVGVREEFGCRPSRLLLLMVGRLEPQKAHQDLLLALSDVRAGGGEEFLCVLAGDGELRGVLEAEVARLGLQEHVLFAGFRRDVPRLLAACDLFVMSSRWEGLPIALLEAMACAKAVVVTAVGGVPDVVRDDVNGFLVPAAEPAAMATRIRQLMDDRDLRVRIGERGRTDVLERFDISRTAAEYSTLYASALGIAGPVDSADFAGGGHEGGL